MKKKAIPVDRQGIAPILVLLLLVLVAGAYFFIFRGKNATFPRIIEQKWNTDSIEGDNEILLQFGYHENELQIYSPQCEPGKNSQGLNAKECVYLLLNKKNQIILFVSYYRDDRFNQLEDYKKYLIQKNLAEDITTVSIGDTDNPITALLYTPLNPDKERKVAVQEYALMDKNGSLFLIDLTDNASKSVQLFNQILTTLKFTK